MTVSPLTCRELVDRLDEHLLGELPIRSRRALEAHLAKCTCCDAYTKTYLAATRIAKAALAFEDGPASGGVPETLVRAIVSACTVQS